MRENPRPKIFRKPNITAKISAKKNKKVVVEMDFIASVSLSSCSSSAIAANGLALGAVCGFGTALFRQVKSFFERKN